jgi:ubiquinone/menaquinone biosynthesis C-methylase UbiE
MDRQSDKRPSIREVKEFWDLNPLFSGEYKGVVGSRGYFEHHERVIINDCMAGSFDDRFVNFLERDRSILDIGCGPGFWVRQFSRRGLEVSACDLSTTAVELTRKSLELFGVQGDVREGNAENLPYQDESFDYINCQGVIHHTPDTEKCVAEFHRVLKPGGLVSFSVYHRNLVLRSTILLKIVSVFLAHRIGLIGRGRENVLLKSNADEIVRRYDGLNNPIGKAFTADEITSMIRSNNLVFIKKWRHYFPARAFPIRIPQTLHKLLNNHFGLLMVFLARKTERQGH